MVNRKGTMVYSDVIPVESALSYFDDAIAYCESICLTDEQLDKLIDLEGEKCVSVESALNCLDDAIAYCESTCLTDEQINSVNYPNGEKCISVESALNSLDDAITYCESSCLTDEQINNLNDPERENIPLNCLQPLLRCAGQWVRKKMKDDSPRNRMMMFSAILLLLFVCSNIAHGVIRPPGPQRIRYLTRRWQRGNSKIKFANLGEPLMISCQTTSPAVKIRLLKGDNARRRWDDTVYYSNGEVIKIGQTFLFQKLGLEHAGHYKCVAVNWNGFREELEKGKLIINPTRKEMYPEIFPNIPILRVKPGQEATITCQAIGGYGLYNSYITWYRRMKDGTMRRVEGRYIQRSEKRVGGNPIDVEMLKFSYFDESESGTYVCVRKEYGSRETKKEIQVVVNRAALYNTDLNMPMLEFETKKWSLDTNKKAAIKIAMNHQHLFISCQTNNPFALVTLLRTPDKSSKWREVKRSRYHQHTVQSGQVFLLTGLSMRDTSFYKCRAVGNHGEMIEMEKGFLVVGSVKADRKPEIFPKTFYPLRRYSSVVITCKAQGILGKSFLKWYRRYYGSYVYVDLKNIQRTKEIIGGNQVDVERLTIREFNQNDAGEYICVRKVPGSKPATASITLRMR